MTNRLTQSEAALPDNYEFQIALIDGRMWVSIRTDGPEGRYRGVYSQSNCTIPEALALIEAVDAYAKTSNTGSWGGGFQFNRYADKWRQEAATFDREYP